MDPIPVFVDKANNFPQQLNLAPGTTAILSVPLHGNSDVQSAVPASTDAPKVIILNPSEIVVSATDTIMTFNPATTCFLPPNSVFPVDSNSKVDYTFTFDFTSGPGTTSNFTIRLWGIDFAGNLVSSVMSTFTPANNTNAQVFTSSLQGGFLAGLVGFYSITIEATSASGTTFNGAFTDVTINMYSGGGAFGANTRFCPWGYFASVPSVSYALNPFVTRENTISVDIRLNDVTATQYIGGSISVVSLNGGFMDYNGLVGYESASTMQKRILLTNTKGVYASVCPYFSPKKEQFQNFGTVNFPVGTYSVIYLRPRPSNAASLTAVPYVLECNAVYEYILNPAGVAVLSPSTAAANQRIIDVLKKAGTTTAIMSENPFHFGKIMNIGRIVLKHLPSALDLFSNAVGSESNTGRNFRKASAIADKVNEALA